MKQVSKYVSPGEIKEDSKKRKEPYGGLRRSFSMSGVPGGRRQSLPGRHGVITVLMVPEFFCQARKVSV